MRTYNVTRNNKPLPKYNPRKILKSFQFGIYTYQNGVLTTPKGYKYETSLEGYLHDFQPFCQKYITITQGKTWNDYLDIWMNEDLEFEGELWQDINSIIVLIDELEERKDKEDDYSIRLQEKVEAMKKELLQKHKQQ